MNIHTAYIPPDEAERIENAVRHGISPEAAPQIGSVDIMPAHHDHRSVEVSFSIPALGAYRTLKVGEGEQSSEEIAQRVRELLADLQETPPAAGGPMSYVQTQEKLAAAVDALVTGKGRIKERLSSAPIRALIHLRPDDLPGDARALFETAITTLTAEPQQSEGRIGASLDAMSEEDAVVVANHLYSALLLTR